MRTIEKVWFTKYWAKWPIILLLLPLSCLFFLVSHLRRCFYKWGIFTAYKMSVPVVVVGNIGVGGNGKTPVVVYLIEACKKQNIKVGVVSRGYGGSAPHYPYLVESHSTAVETGDEALLIYQRCHVPIMLGSNRVASAQALIDLGCELIITDDGLQHYRLERDVELIVVDYKRQYGNGFLLPAGPLREGRWRLSSVANVIYNMSSRQVLAEKHVKKSDKYLTMHLAPEHVRNMVTGELISLSDFLAKFPQVNAIAGIGDPERFFTTLKDHGFSVLSSQGFNDHHAFSVSDFSSFSEHHPLLMTEKDAVKCTSFAKQHWWCVPVNAQFNSKDNEALIQSMHNVLSIKH